MDSDTLSWQLPYLTPEMPGAGGRLRVTCEDFQVEEVPLYEPCGEGEHTFFAVEKRDISTPVLMRAVAKALGVERDAVSAAGLKDARAVARQVLSVQFAPPEQLLALELPNARVLWAKQHTNKLRVGHLQGNRFTIRIRAVHPEAAARVKPILETLVERGTPNGYGVQRFGNDGLNHEVGLLLLRKDRPALRERGIGSLPFREHRFYLSALQSALFNRYLAARIERGLLDGVLPGDIAKKQDTGGMFTVENVAIEARRAAQWEISAAGPIYGYKMMPAQADAAALEAEILARAGIAVDEFRAAKLKGTRRPIRYRPEDLRWHSDGDALVLSFFAPKGAFATMLLREIMKTTDDREESAD
ncbi:MAG: tRNA pseudouridine(13) synthase TruD [Anaerolineae bacterium]|nr:tRNA pseudouridine(13) synthase TruD [Anaerolineae bacterium]